MSDNFTPAVDDISGVGYPRIKITLGPDGTNTADLAGRDIGSGVGAAYVDPRPSTAYTDATSTGLTTSVTAYTAGDVLGGELSWANFARTSGGTGAIVSAVLIDKADITEAVDLYLFDRSVTFGTDNAAPSLSDADAAYCVGRVAFTTEDLGGVRVGLVDSVHLRYRCNATTLYGYLVTRSGHTFFGATTDLIVRLAAVLD